MKPLILPYCTYNFYTLDELMMLTALAQVRVQTVTSLLIAKAHYQRALAGQVDQAELDVYHARFKTLLDTIGEIDQALYEFAVIHGRVN